MNHEDNLDIACERRFRHCILSRCRKGQLGLAFSFFLEAAWGDGGWAEVHQTLLDAMEPRRSVRHTAFERAQVHLLSQKEMWSPE
jgi:hypothetical protein